MHTSTISGSRHFRFGDFDVDIRSGEIRRLGAKIKLQEQPFQVLVMLLQKPGELVTRKEIEERLWPETIVEFASNLNAAIKRLRSALDDSPDKPQFIETVPRRGYRFVAKVDVHDGAPEASPPAVDPSIAVLPFRDRSPDSDQEYFCDGITEEFIDALTKIDNLRVVSRTSSFQYKNRIDDVRKIGAELQVGALMEGNLRKTAGTIRITIRLTRVSDGCHVWSDTYESDVHEVFDIQYEITAAIINALNHTMNWSLSHSPRSHLILSKPTMTRDLVAYDLYLQGLYFWNLRSTQGAQSSIPYFQQAVERDGSYALAHAALAQAFMLLASTAQSPKERAQFSAKGQREIENYLRLIQDDYEQKDTG